MDPIRPIRGRAEVAAKVAALIDKVRPGTTADHVGSTVAPGLIGKNVVDLQISADPADVGFAG